MSTVDAYQGREADAVVITTVRCNDRGSLGFVTDERRLNVAITRPRRCPSTQSHRIILKVKEGWEGEKGEEREAGGVVC